MTRVWFFQAKDFDLLLNCLNAAEQGAGLASDKGIGSQMLGEQSAFLQAVPQLGKKIAVLGRGAFAAHSLYSSVPGAHPKLW